MLYKVIISKSIACQFALLPALAQAQSSDVQYDWARAEQAPFNQEAYLETDLQWKLNNQRILLPKNREPTAIGIAKKIGIGTAAAALFAGIYSGLLWLLLQSCLLVFVPKAIKKPASEN